MGGLGGLSDNWHIKSEKGIGGEKIMFNFNSNRKSVSDIYRMFNEQKLVVDDTYQRRSVWSEKDKIRLIETILLNLIIPVKR